MEQHHEISNVWGWPNLGFVRSFSFIDNGTKLRGWVTNIAVTINEENVSYFFSSNQLKKYLKPLNILASFHWHEYFHFNCWHWEISTVILKSDCLHCQVFWKHSTVSVFVKSRINAFFLDKFYTVNVTYRLLKQLLWINLSIPLSFCWIFTYIFVTISDSLKLSFLSGCKSLIEWLCWMGMAKIVTFFGWKDVFLAGYLFDFWCRHYIWLLLTTADWDTHDVQ